MKPDFEIDLYDSFIRLMRLETQREALSLHIAAVYCNVLFSYG